MIGTPPTSSPLTNDGDTPPPNSRAWLVDSHAQIWRAWHVWDKDLTDPAGRPVNALQGFADFLLGLLESVHAPQAEDEAARPMVICAFDGPGNRAYRQAIYADYKAHRPPAPEALTEQMPRCRELVQAAGLAAVDHYGYEADDVIGTLVGMVRGRTRAVTIITGDKDLAQLLGPDDRWYNPMRQSVMAYGDVQRRFGVRPTQVADWLALTGDTSDNIPGVPGIGPRIAANLLRKHGSIDGIYQNLAAVHGMKFRGAPRVRHLLSEHEETVRLSRRLTGIIRDLPLGIVPEAWFGLDPDRLMPLLEAAGVDAGRRARWARLARVSEPTAAALSV